MRRYHTGCDWVCIGLIVALSFAVIAIGRFMGVAPTQPSSIVYHYER